MDDKELFYKEFYSALEKAVEPDGGQLQEVSLPKNNGMKDGILIRFADTSLAPVVYPEFYYPNWQEGQFMEDIVSGIKSGLIRTAPDQNETGLENVNRGAAGTHLRASIASYENNKEWLKDIPHERMEDLALFARWDFDSGYTATVTDYLLAKMQLTKEEALKISKANTAQKADFQSMDRVMRDMMAENGITAGFSEDIPHTPLYVLSNQGMDGAALMACPEVLRQIHGQLGEDFYVLPSSIHEVLILPKSEVSVDVVGLKRMVCSINRQDVPPEDRLSDNVYEFDGHKLKLAGTELTQGHDISDSLTHHRSR